MLSQPSFRRGIRDGLVLFAAVGAFGIAFGVLAVEIGLGAWLAVVASLIVVSGAAQFALIGLLAAGPVPVLVATTGLALRHVPMSARMAVLLGERGLWVRLRLAWILVDETFGLTVTASGRGEPNLVAYKTAVDLLLYSGWVAGTAAGALLGGRIDPAALGVDVFFAVMFIGLAAPFLKTRWDGLVALLALGATFAASSLLPDAWTITVAAIAAAAVGGALPHE